MLKPIKIEKGYTGALARAYALIQTDLKKGSTVSDEMEILNLLIKEYKLVHYPIAYL